VPVLDGVELRPGARRPLADNLAGNVDRLPGVVLSSERSLFLDGPEVDEMPLPRPEEESLPRYRYKGLRLLEHTGGHYFLVSIGVIPPTASYGCSRATTTHPPRLRA
jgi:hypothetical protein